MLPVEEFTDAERATLAQFVTDVDAPVFALVNLPETVKGALFARYSRYPGTLRRLLLDEFADDLPSDVAPKVSAEGKRASALYDRIFLGYGDDSVAQLGGAHIACEWVSNIMTKILQRPRLGSYLEQSTRYIAYDQPVPDGGYRYYRNSELGPSYEQAMDYLFDTYASLLPRVSAWAAEQFPAGLDESPAAHSRAIKAKALDLVRGLLPAASLSHMGIFASGQTFESLILHLLAHPLPEARNYGEMMLSAMKATMPSFVSRIEHPDRGGRWLAFLRRRTEEAGIIASRFGLDRDATHEGPSVRLVHVDGTEELLLTALLFEASDVGGDEIRRHVAQLSADERTASIAALIGLRENRRHRPGRGFEALRYRFEIVSDYGAFRDLQRHRMLTVQWQTLSPHLGASVPEEISAAGLTDDYRAAVTRSREAWRALVEAGDSLHAPYALCLAYRVRYVLDLNAREAMHVVELRSGREGHPSYRAIAHEMHRLIREVHPAVGDAMKYVDMTDEPRLERILSEIRSESRRRLFAAEQGE
ncbi:MAG TPA: FAD-dependent thymidylate synthase [Solirubrobacteraceae bacterium]|nr:FAD-dependent thymidylate synthase [Solirubrobacteraceae bacterium]